MEIELIRNQNHNYACIRLTEEQLHAHERSMLLYNHVPCLLPLNMRYVDELLQEQGSRWSNPSDSNRDRSDSASSGCVSLIL